MTLLLTLLGAMLCSLMVSSEEVPSEDFSLKGIAGKWYLIAFASNDPWFLNRRGSLKMGTTVFTLTDDGDVKVTHSTLNPDGSCWRFSNLAKKTAVPEKLTFTSKLWGNLNDLRFVDTKYDEYAITHTMVYRESNISVVNKLYGREAELTPELQEKFKQYSLDGGILPENIVFLAKNAECKAV